MRMRFGEFKGKPVAEVPIKYLVWMLSMDSMRFKYWPECKEALGIIRARGLDNILAELRVDTPPPSRKPTPEQIAQRQAEKAEKLRQLEQRRAEERARRKAANRAARVQAEMEMDAALLRRRRGETAPGGIIDASQFVTRPRQTAEDISDLL